MSQRDRARLGAQHIPEGKDAPAVVARDASYVQRGYRSFEFATFEAAYGRCCALLSRDHACERDALLAIAGAVRPSAGSLVVAGEERAARSRMGRRGHRYVGIGVMSGVLDQDCQQTVEEAVAHALRLARAKIDPLEHLARFEIATFAAQRIEQIPAAARARLSCALALAGSSDIAVVDLADPFAAGLSVVEGEAIVRLLSALAHEDDTAAIVGTCEPALARAADTAVGLDLESTEALNGAAAVGIASPSCASPAVGDDVR